MWRVHWDECNKTADHEASHLKFLFKCANDFDAMLVDVFYIGDHDAMLNWTMKNFNTEQIRNNQPNSNIPLVSTYCKWCNSYDFQQH